MEVAATQTIDGSGELPKEVDLWSLTPNFATKTFKDKDRFAAYADSLAERSSADANLVVWINVDRFGEMGFWYPSFDQWIRHGFIVSGSGDRTVMGVVFANSIENRWGTKVLWSPVGGIRSSQTCRWVLKKAFRKTEGLVCDPYAKSPDLAVWCRRFNLGYRGYTRNQAVRARIEKELAQMEIPGIQEELPLLMNGE